MRCCPLLPCIFRSIKNCVIPYKKGALGVWKFYKMGLSWQVVKIHLMMPLCTWHNILKGYYGKKGKMALKYRDRSITSLQLNDFCFAFYYVSDLKSWHFRVNCLSFFLWQGELVQIPQLILRPCDRQMLVFFAKNKFCNICATWENCHSNFTRWLKTTKKSHFESHVFATYIKSVKPKSETC